MGKKGKKKKGKRDLRDLVQKGDWVELSISDRPQGAGLGRLNQGDRLVQKQAGGDPVVHDLGPDSPLLGATAFVEDCFPGDRVRFQVQKVKKNFMAGGRREVLSPSDLRVPPPCPYAKDCDGCGLIEMDYASQIHLKESWLVDDLVRLGKLDPAFVDQLGIQVHSLNRLHYRNKLGLRVTREGKLAYRKRGSHDPVVVDSCPVALPILSDLIGLWNASPLDPGLASYIKLVTLRANKEGETMIFLIMDRRGRDHLDKVFDQVKALIPDVLAACFNGKRDGVRPRGPVFYGTEKKSLAEEVLGLNFQISPTSFFQVNREVAEAIYKEAMGSFTGLEDSGVLDLYCGIGTTSLVLAQVAKKVLGLEVSGQAVRDAQANARTNGVDHVHFIRTRVEEAVVKISQLDPGFNKALVDPPRAGLGRKVVGGIIKSKVEELAYISCNPASLARDIHWLGKGGFQVKTVQAFDMFPNTDHVECFTLLRRENR